MVTAQRRLTLEQFLALPERKPALEFADGVVTQKVAPKLWHSRLQWEVAALFNHFAEPRGLAFAFPELRCTFGGRSQVPDVAVIRWERLPVTASGELEQEDYREPPDIAVEIVSPRQSVRALEQRCRWYVEHGVEAALLVDPQPRSIRVFRPGGSMEIFRGTDSITFGDILPGFVLDVQALFASLSLR